MIKATEEQIEAGRAAVFAIGADPVAAETLEAIYLAMRAKEAPCPDDVERVIEQLVAEGRRGRHMHNAEQNEALDDEARAFYRKVYERFRAALSSIQGVRTSSGTDGGERQHG